MSGICEEEWQEIVQERIEKDMALNVRTSIVFLKVLYKILYKMISQLFCLVNYFFQVCSTIIQEEVEVTYRHIQKYLATLNPFKDLWSLQPKRVLELYKNKARDSVRKFS